MKNRIRILLTLSILVLLTSACFPRLVRTTPDSESQTPISEGQDLAAFTEIDIEAAGPVFLIQGNTHSIQIEGPKGAVEDITFEVRNGVLIIKHSNNIWDWITARDYPTITITFNDLTRFILQGGTELVADDLDTESLTMQLEGGASVKMSNLNVTDLVFDVEGGMDINIDGVAETQTLRFAGGTSYDAENLKSADVKLKIEGAVTATIWATELLDLNLSGAYDVKYYGNPSVTQSVQGVGNVESLGEK